jgi:hypothetical protein
MAAGGSSYRRRWWRVKRKVFLPAAAPRRAVRLGGVPGPRRCPHVGAARGPRGALPPPPTADRSRMPSSGARRAALGGAGRRVAEARDGGGAVREGDGVARGTMEIGGRRGGAQRDSHGDGGRGRAARGAIDWPTAQWVGGI